MREEHFLDNHDLKWMLICQLTPPQRIEALNRWRLWPRLDFNHYTPEQTVREKILKRLYGQQLVAQMPENNR